MAERLLLTGATGFVGRALVAPLLAQGFEVHAVSRQRRSPKQLPPPRVAEGRGGGCATSEGVIRHHAVDLLDAAAARALLRDVRPKVLVHAAWYVAHGRFWTAAENAEWVEASDSLATAFAEAGGRRFIGIGTCVEYADHADDVNAPWPETRPLAPTTPYGHAKAELGTRLARRQDLSVTWARLFHLFGEGEHPDRLVPSVARALVEGREALCASGRPVRDFASTRFVGRALAAVADSDVTGPVNVASGEGRAIGDLVRGLGILAGRPDLIRLGAVPDRPGEVPRMVADVTRLRREVGFAELPDVEADLRKMLEGMVGATGIEPVTLRV